MSRHGNSTHMLNPLQELIRAHCESHNETLADIALRAGMSRQTLSAIMNKDGGEGVPRATTLAKLAKGLNLSLRVVQDAASEAAMGRHGDQQYDRRVVVLIDHVQRMTPGQVDVLLATARALQALDTPNGR